MAPFALRGLGVENLLRQRSLLGALVFRDSYVAARSWEPWCSEMFTLPLALGSLGVRSPSGALALRACYVTARPREPERPELDTSPLAVGSLGVQRRCRSLLGALVSKIVYVIAGSWEPWCGVLVTTLSAVGSLGVKSFLRYRSLLYWASAGLPGGPFGAL